MAKQRCRGIFICSWKRVCFAEDEKFDFWSCGFKGSSKCPQPHHQPSHCNPLHLFFMSDFFQSLKHEMRCIVASVFVVFPAQLEAGGTQNSEMGGKRDLVRFCLPAKLTKPGMPGEPCCGCNIPGPQLLHPFLVVCSLLIPKHPLIPKSLSGRCTKPDPAVGAADGRIIQSLNLFHLFLWLRIVQEQMAIFSSVSIIRSHSLRQRWLKQIPGPLQSHHLVFPSAQPPLSAWARLPREAGSPESLWMWSAPIVCTSLPLHL